MTQIVFTTPQAERRVRSPSRRSLTAAQDGSWDLRFNPGVCEIAAHIPVEQTGVLQALLHQFGETNQQVLITEHGQPLAVVVSVET